MLQLIDRRSRAVARAAARLGLALLVSGIAAAAASAQGTRLGSIYALARASDAQFAAARAAAEAGREKLPQALAGLRPTVNLTHSVKRNRDGSTAFDDTLSYEAGTSAIVFTQPLFRVANRANADQAEWQVLQAEQQLGLAEQDLMLRVSRVYFDVLQAGDELAAATAQREALVQQLAQARRSFEVGTVPITDANEAQARHDLAVAQEIAARNEIQSRRRVLERSIGGPSPALARLKDDAQVGWLGEDQQLALVESAPRNSLAVQLARSAVGVADKEIAKRDAAHTPTLDLVASVGVNRNVNYGAFGGNDTRQASIGLEMSFPVYQGGGVSSRAREAIAERKRVGEELVQAERQALLDAQQAQLGLQTSVALTQALRQALASSESQLRSTQRGQEVGIRTRVDVLNAQQQVYTTLRDLAGARYRSLVSWLQLKAAAGVLAASDLRALDSLLAD